MKQLLFSTMAIAATMTVVVSTNAQNTPIQWAQTNASQRGQGHLDTFNGKIIALHGPGGIWTSDNATDWTRTDTGLAPIYQYCGSYAYFNYQGTAYTSKRVNPNSKPSVYSSTNGTNWTLVSEVTPATATPVGETSNITTIYRNADVMLVGTGENIYYSTDGGLTWTVSSFASGITNKSIKANIVELNGALYAASEKNVLKSTDNGVNWTSVYQVASMTNDKISSLAKIDNGLLISGQGAAKGIYRTLDDGATWTVVREYNDARYVQSVGSFIFAQHSQTDLFQSNDNGTTWHDIEGKWYKINGDSITGQDRAYSLTIFNDKLYALGSLGVFTCGAPRVFTTTGVEDISNTLSFDIYPNPANNTITIAGVPEGSSVSVADITGRVLYTEKTNRKNVTVHVHDFTTGVYLVRIENGKAVATKKFIKE